MASKSSQVAEGEQAQVAAQEAAQRSLAGPGREVAALRPPVDIYENDEGITLEADMPGVSKERLEVRVDGQTLLVEGNVQFDLPEKADALYADVRSTAYRRTFQLSRELETDKIQANLKDGVLRVHIPKRSQLQPRRIEVQSS